MPASCFLSPPGTCAVCLLRNLPVQRVPQPVDVSRVEKLLLDGADDLVEQFVLLHGVAVQLERRWTPTGWLGHLWTCAVVLGPLPLLFHEPFFVGIVRPLFGG